MDIDAQLARRGFLPDEDPLPRFGDDSESTACELVRLDAEVEEKGEGGDVALRFSFSS